MGKKTELYFDFSQKSSKNFMISCLSYSKVDHTFERKRHRKQHAIGNFISGGRGQSSPIEDKWGTVERWLPVRWGRGGGGE